MSTTTLFVCWSSIPYFVDLVPGTASLMIQRMHRTDGSLYRVRTKGKLRETKLHMQGKIAAPRVLQTVPLPFVALSKTAQDAAAEAAVAASGALAGCPHVSASDGQQPQQGPETGTAPIGKTLSQLPHELQPDSTSLGQQQGVQRGRMQEGPAATAHTLLGHQAHTVEAPQSPASATHAAHVLAGLVSPEAEHRHGAIEAAVPSFDMKQEGRPAGRLTQQQKARCSPPGPGQSRLDELLGVVPPSGNSFGEDRPNRALDAQPDVKESSCQGSGHDSMPGQEAVDRTASHSQAKPDATPGPGAVQPANQSELCRGLVSEKQAGGAQSALERVPVESLMPLAVPEHSSAGGLLAGSHAADVEADAAQPSVSMAAAGSFCNFQVAAGGQAQWRHLLSGKQVHPIRPANASIFRNACLQATQDRLDLQDFI